MEKARGIEPVYCDGKEKAKRKGKGVMEEARRIEPACRDGKEKEKRKRETYDEKGIISRTSTL